MLSDFIFAEYSFCEETVGVGCSFDLSSEREVVQNSANF